MALFCRENQLVQALDQEKKSSKESSWFGDPRCKLGSNARPNSRIQFVGNESKLVPTNLELGPHLKWALVSQCCWVGESYMNTSGHLCHWSKYSKTFCKVTLYHSRKSSHIFRVLFLFFFKSPIFSLIAQKSITFAQNLRNTLGFPMVPKVKQGTHN